MTGRGPRALRATLRRHGVRPSKRWGQNFLINPRIPERLIAAWDLDADTGVCEIGSGTGALTLPLLARGHCVVAIERDRRLCAVLRERVEEESPGGELRLWEDDVRKLEPREVLFRPDGPRRWVLVGNLPYVITTPVLEWAIRGRDCYQWASFMIQREVAARLLAGPGCKAYGSLTLWVGYHFGVEKELAVGAANFWPMPKVESVVVRLTPHADPPVAVPAAPLGRVIRAGFGQRRKILAGALARGLGLGRTQSLSALEAAGIPSRRRAEECTLAEFAALTRALLQSGWLSGGGDGG